MVRRPIKIAVLEAIVAQQALGECNGLAGTQDILIHRIAQAQNNLEVLATEHKQRGHIDDPAVRGGDAHPASAL